MQTTLTDPKDALLHRIINAEQMLLIGDDEHFKSGLAILLAVSRMDDETYAPLARRIVGEHCPGWFITDGPLPCEPTKEKSNVVSLAVSRAKRTAVALVPVAVCCTMALPHIGAFLLSAVGALRYGAIS